MRINTLDINCYHSLPLSSLHHSSEIFHTSGWIQATVTQHLPTTPISHSYLCIQTFKVTTERHLDTSNAHNVR